MAKAYAQVAEASAKDRALASVKAQPKDKVSLAKAPWDKEDKTKKEAMDPVDAKALKGKHKDRKDKDIDNDGDVDSSDEYLHKRRKGVSKSMKGKSQETEVEVLTQESVEELDEAKKVIQDLGGGVKAVHEADGGITFVQTSSFGKDMVILGAKQVKALHRKMMNEEVELDEAKTDANHKLMLKALGKTRLPKDHGHRTSVANNGDFVVANSGGRIIGRLKKGTHDAPTMSGKNEAVNHGNMNNGSPRGEGLSPSAKKELDRTTPMNPATDELATNALNFKTFKSMTKKAPKRTGDNDAGDKTMPKNDGK